MFAPQPYSLGQAALTLCCLFFAIAASAAADERSPTETDLLIVGGTESGWAAAIQAARMGVESIVLVNDIEWLGGQFTAEGLCAVDENRGVGRQVPFPRSGLFKELTDRIEAHNKEKYGHAQPGNAWTARTTFRPAEGAAIFRQMIEPYVRSSQVRILSNAYAVAAEFADDQKTLRSVRFRSTSDETKEFVIDAQITIDASDWGEVIQRSGAAFEYGPDLKSKYGQPHAPTDREKYPLTDMNPITWCMVIEETDEEQVVDKPPHYDDRRYFLTTSVTKPDYEALGWPHRPHRPFNPPWMPKTGKFYSGDRTVYSQRRLIDHYNLDIDHPDVILLCWSVQDYPLDRLSQWVVDDLEATEPGASEKNIVTMTRRQRQIIFDDAKRHSLGMLHHLQTTVHDRMADKAHSFRRFRLSKEFGTPDRLPPKPYIRESLRLKAMTMMREQDTLNTDPGGKGQARDQFARVMYPDGVACWQFVYDFHPTGRAFLPGTDASGPWDIYIKPGRSWVYLSDRSLFPLRSLVPEKIDGLLGGQKNLGYSSIVSSAVRLHDQSIAIGQAAGATAAVCLASDVQPRTIPFDGQLLGDIRRGLCNRNDGAVPLILWPFRDIEPKHPAFEAVNLLAARQGLPLDREEVDFRPDDPAKPDWRAAVVEKSLSTKKADNRPQPPDGPMTRGEFVHRWWAMIEDLRDKPIDPATLNDGKGTADAR